MSSFKTQQEIYKHLADGGKVKHIDGEILGFKDGVLWQYDTANIGTSYKTYAYGEWLPYHEPLKIEFEADLTYIPLREGYFIDVPIVDKKGALGKRFKCVLTEIVE